MTTQLKFRSLYVSRAYNNPGYNAKATFSGDIGEVSLVLPPELGEEVLKVCANAINQHIVLAAQTAVEEFSKQVQIDKRRDAEALPSPIDNGGDDAV